MKHSGELTGKELNPNDAEVYQNPALVRLLEPREQMIAIINLAKTGRIVSGDEVLSLELMLSNAGYRMSPNGQLDAEEMAALENFKHKLEDHAFKEAAGELIAMMTGAAAVEEIVLPSFGKQPDAPAVTPAQSAAIKIMLGLTPFKHDF